MLLIEREIDIRLPVDNVFDFVVDGRNEPRYNPHMLHSEQDSPGPIRRGTRFRTGVTRMGRSMEMTYEITAYKRPHKFTSRTIKAPVDVQSTVIFDAAPAGTRMRWVWQVEPRGVFKLLPPLVSRTMGQSLDEVLANIKRVLETPEVMSPKP